ncbi:MAG: N-acetyltransferase [Candidatus Abyssobacteria bacterium SURF_5]|uniref:N-acetyltransferase n=1 Tax=Abyssobacteria bacterium (strain SURF_5) TaxID=2093360 RepID=A0A3A4P1P3_ABYX5|nr:MAG: N-acetyltransferase [Candidatus Abyssubacteria bacterium SURF_5]
MQIRKAGLEDQAQVIALMKKLLIPSGEVNSDWNDEARIFDRIIENPELGAVLVAEEEGVIAGATTLSYPVAMRCNGVYSCIEENIVDERFRGKGVGGKLLRAAIAEAAARGCDEIQVNAPSEMGYPLYIRNGFTDAGKKHIKAKLPVPPNPQPK